MKSNPKFFVGERLSTTKHKGPVHNVSPAGAEIYFEKGKRPYNKMNTHTIGLNMCYFVSPAPYSICAVGLTLKVTNFLI